MQRFPAVRAWEAGGCDGLHVHLLGRALARKGACCDLGDARGLH